MFGFFAMTFVIIALSIIVSVSMLSSMENKMSYIALYDRCLIRPDCCKLSVDHMRENNLMHVEERENCPEGYIRRSLECPGTLFWCESIKK